jgi:hypothetical protein
LDLKSSKNSPKDTLNGGLSPLARMAISNKLTALRAMGSPRSTDDSSVRSCIRESLLESTSHRIRM